MLFTKIILPSLSKRLQLIQDCITKSECNLVDVGCDHCKTCIYAINSHKAKFCYNIDNNKQPLVNGIKNISQYNLLAYTKNILANGLETNEIDHNIDYCVISGIGGKNITNILKNRNKDIKINSFILLANDNSNVIREYIKKNNEYKIANEDVVFDEGNYYFLIVLSKKGYIPKNDSDIFLGRINISNNKQEFLNYLTERKSHLSKFIDLSTNKLILKELDEINKLIK